MTLPIHDTPLAQAPGLPERRGGGWNEALTPALIQTGASAGLLDRLRLPGALVVTTGQQPGLFTGPAYAVSKALSARALAVALERRWGRPVIPVYWIPGDDHDFDEVSSAAWLAGDGDLVRATLDLRSSDAPLTPMFRQPLGASVLTGLEAFERSLPASEGRDRTVQWLRRHYTPAQTVAHAFGGAIAELLAPFGVICFDSTHRAAKAAAAPFLVHALRDAAALDRTLADRASALQAQGTDPGVPVGDGATLVFLEDAEGRDRLVQAGGGFATRRGKRPLSLAELETIAAAQPERLSANVLLRPVLESFLLPTVAYAAGPGELRYLALAEALYQPLGVARQRPVPRWSGLLIEPRVTRVLAKFSATLQELLDDGGGLEARLARLALPQDTEQAFAALRAAIDAGFDPVVRIATQVDPTLERPAASARAQALFGAQELEKKLLQHARKREAIELQQVARARLSVRPEGKPQERVLSMAGFLGRYGWELLDALSAHVEAWYGRALEAASPTT
ncbi:MAG TPA: bacillithiol biosynthesis cysteine-adding enzyme BshC [Gemmatimonadales bacterium]|nr:bacillithiol biosynthesis cysteine-adding enzyme BshC [Gemmatimonadales bacterium]